MEHVLFSSERMTLAEALSMYTIEAAFAARAEEPTLRMKSDAAFGSSEYFCLWIKDWAKRRIYVDLCSDSVILKNSFLMPSVHWGGGVLKILNSWLQKICALNFWTSSPGWWDFRLTRKRSALEVWSLEKKQISSSFRARRMLRQCWKPGRCWEMFFGDLELVGKLLHRLKGGIYGSKWVMFNSDGFIFDWRHKCQGEY